MRQPKTPRERLFLRRVLKNKTDPRRMARSLGMRLEELADWMDGPQVGRLVRGMTRLGDSEAGLTLSQLRTATVACMGSMISNSKAASGETLRRTCSDILKGQINPPVEPVAPHGEPAEPVEPNPQQIQQMQQRWETIGRDGNGTIPGPQATVLSQSGSV